MAVTITRPARVIALTANEDASLAALLYQLATPEAIMQLSNLGIVLGRNQIEEIAGLWDQIYGGKSAKA